MDIQLKLSTADWKTYNAHVLKRAMARLYPPQQGFWSGLGPWVTVVTFWFGCSTAYGLSYWYLGGLLLALLLGLFLYEIYKQLRALQSLEPQSDGVFCGDHQFSFSAAGISSKGQGYQAQHAWSIVKGIEREGGIIVIYLDRVLGFVLPESQLQDPDGCYAELCDLYARYGHQDEAADPTRTTH